MSSRRVALPNPEPGKYAFWVLLGSSAPLWPLLVSEPARKGAVVGAIIGAMLGLAAAKELLTRRHLTDDDEGMTYERALLGLVLERQRVVAPTEVSTHLLRITPRAKTPVIEVRVIGDGELRWLAYGHEAASLEATAARRLLSPTGLDEA